MSIVSVESGSESDNDTNGKSQNIRHKEKLKSSNPIGNYNEFLENSGRKDLQHALKTSKSKGNDLQSNKDEGSQRKESRKNKVKLNDKCQYKGSKESQNTEKRGGQQIELQRVKIAIVGDSQLKRLDETKLSNHHHQVKIMAKGGSRIRQATQQVGQSDSDIIVVHAGTDDIKSSNPEALSDDIINTLNKVQESNPSSQIV